MDGYAILIVWVGGCATFCKHAQLFGEDRGAVGGVGGKGWELVVEEEVVVGVAAEGSSELDGEFGDVHV
eukprot:scaffold2869_cov193-Amphora_coffeaeformis.AAC.1